MKELADNLLNEGSGAAKRMVKKWEVADSVCAWMNEVMKEGIPDRKVSKLSQPTTFRS